MLRLYAKVFDTVEIDSTFYAIPSEQSVRGWADRTPEGFTFSVKLPSEITHKNRLRQSEGLLSDFLSRMRLMGDKLGCVLIQLPPDFSRREHGAVAKFLELLPKGTRFAIEFRDSRWISEQTISLLRDHEVGLTLTDSKWVERDLSFTLAGVPTASHVYVRWLGPRELTDFSRIQIDRTRELGEWAEAFNKLVMSASQIYGYFNNHYQGHSPASCNYFKRLLGLPVVDPDELVVQPSLF
jgi:uncharacterized protein YecE (DUF72 family)